MADKKISQLTDGTSLQSGDFVVVARSGDNFKVDPTIFDEITATTVDINGGTIDGTTIGGSSAGAITGTTGQFNTSLNVDGTATLDGLSVNDGTDGVINIGTSTYVTTSTSTLNFQTGWGDSGYRRLEMRGFDSGSSGAKRGGLLNFSQIGRPGVSNRSVLYFSNSEIVFNDDGTNLDFRVESDNNANMLSVDAGNDRVGIGTSSVSAKFQVNVDTDANIGFNQTGGVARISCFDDAFSNSSPLIINGSDLSFTISTIEAMHIDSSGNVGIGTSSPGDLLELSGESGQPAIRLTDTNVSGLFHRIYTPGNTGLGISADTGNVAANSFLRFDVDGTERMRIDDSGNVGIGTSSPASVLHAVGGIKSGLVDNSDNAKIGGIDLYGATTSGSRRSWAIKPESTVPGTLGFWVSSANNTEPTSGNQVVSISKEGNVGIGTSSPTTGLECINSNGQITGRSSKAANTSTSLRLMGGAYTGNTATAILLDGISGENQLKFGGGTAVGEPATSIAFHIGTAGSTGAGTERMRIDSSGNLLVGTTSTANTTDGVRLLNSGYIAIAQDTNNVPCGFFNKITHDGNILEFQKDGTTVGSIGTRVGTLFIRSPDGTNGSGLKLGDGQITPCNSDGSGSDDDTNLGSVTARFDDIYATNGTIQTSDRNEKQDIEELSEAERRVAVAVKGLLRKFRWISSVEEKGDDARIHFGIIAQDLQAAFEAEGLDAGRYAMFIHSTWTDEETGEERSRMGVRYSELLAFIIAAL